MALLDQCSFAYSDPTQVIVGQVFSFAVAVPPLVPTTVVSPTLLDTATAATIVWRISDTATSNRLVPEDDYQIVSGGLNQMAVSFVINPSRTARFNVQPLLTIAGGGTAQVISNGAAGWGPITYTPVGSNSALLQAKAASVLHAALQLTTSADLIEPGASVTLKVIQTAMTSTPQIV